MWLNKLFREVNHMYCEKQLDALVCETQALFEGKVDRASLQETFSCLISEDPLMFDLFLSSLPGVAKALAKDRKFFYESDPAVDSEEEIAICYPGYTAIFYYRVAHILWQMGFRMQARILSEAAHSKTGIDIHPGARIGSPFFIDHGTGIVIGETAEVGNRVKIYQGVTLGAVSLKDGRKLANSKRHPTVGNDVTIYSNATILGGDVVIGDNVVIGSNVTIIESIPANTEALLIPFIIIIIFFI